MLSIKETIIVEGKYDKIKLSGFVDADIITTDGFSIFKDPKKRKMLKDIAQKRGIIILTDSDSAGFVIRGHLSGILPNGTYINVFVPEIKGKEKRKITASAEGLLGVEGLSEEVIKEAFLKAGVGVTGQGEKKAKLTKADLFELGLCGKQNSALCREQLLLNLNLPTKMSTSQMLTALNALFDRDEFLEKFSGGAFDA